MLEYFICNEDVRENILTGPMGPYLPPLAARLLETGYSKGQARRLLLSADGLARWLQRNGTTLTEAGSEQVEAYSLSLGRTAAGKRLDTGTGLTRIAELLKPWGILNASDPANRPDPVLKRFDDHLRTVRGLSETTRVGQQKYLQPFIAGLHKADAPDWSRLTSSYLAEYLTAKLPKVRAAKKGIIAAVRSFLRFLIMEGLVSKKLLKTIPRIRCWRYANLPEPLSPEMHALVLQACQSEATGSRRHRAFVALLATLGIRGGELRQLCLEDIDWNEGKLLIRKGKSARERVLPLSADAGALLAEYVQHDRPLSPYREVFLTSLAPRRPLGGGGTTYLVHQFLKRCSIEGARLGTHCFRHTAATLMVRNGATLKEVADVLGHCSIATTSIYVKLDQPSLQNVAMPWPGGEQ
jgi:site-specific recombinase XerD